MKEVIKVSQKTWEELKEKLNEEEKIMQDLKVQRAMRLAEPTDIIDEGQGVFDQALSQKRLDDLQKVYDSCIPIENPKHTDYVVLGHKVTFQKGDKKVSLIIDGVALHSKMMSVKSRVGRELLGKKVGDVVNGVKIIDIEIE